ncbi:MAG: HEAT repeat domain-containing protein [Cyanobacteriota bacterium]|nr:HEAT repeat domain-containing protein [Cyanobacteriota bacterium]
MSFSSGSASLTPGDVADLLDSQDLGDRLRAVNQTRYLHPDVGFDLLVKAARDNNARVRYAAISQIGTLTLGDPSAALALLQQSLKEDPEFDVRAAAAAALGDLKQPQALTDLLEAYQRESEWLVQFSIVAALGELGNPEAVETLMQALDQGSDLIRTAAAAALGDLADPRAIPVLEKFIGADDWQLRYRIGLALARIGGEQVRPGLQRLAADPMEQVANQARASLEKLSD